jgi:uncharacterized membrane protein YccC
MIPLSTRTKEAIKISLAMVIAFGIALWMDWERPYWAGFAVAFISLDTLGASLNKGAMRMLGTLVAIVAAFTFLALFPQQRWLFTTVVSLYVGLCAYMMTGKKRQYFWYASGFICVVIAVNSSNSLNAFQIAVERAQETGTGILVYSLVSALLWPQSSGGAFEDASRKLWATQARLYRSYRSLMSGKGSAEDSKQLRLQEVQLLTQSGQLLNAAEADSYEVWEVRHKWRHFHQLSRTLRETLDRWRDSFPQIRDLDLPKALPNLDSLSLEIDRRFAEIEHMLAGQAPAHLPEAIALKIDGTEVRALGHFQKAAVGILKTQLDRLEALSRELFDCVRDLKGFGGPASKLLRKETPRRGLTIDPDRLQGAITVMATLWIAFLIWVYVDPPGHASFVMMSTTLMMVAVRVGMSTARMALPLILSTIFAGILYVFVMPHLSGYGQLGLMIFVVTFGITYLFSAPRQAGVKLIAMAMFANNISVQNQQAYSFASFANGLAMICLVAALIIATAYIPRSPRPEKVFLRLLQRFFHQVEFMMSRLALDWDQRKGWAVRWKMILYRNNLLELPEKLAVLGQRIDYRLLPDATPEKVQVLVTNLQSLAYRINELMEARESPQAESLVNQYHDDLRAWRMVIQKHCRLWAQDPATATARGIELEKRLAAWLARLEARIDETYRQVTEDELSERDYENFFRYLGSLRNLSEAAIDYAQLAEGVNWTQWQEARF